MANPQKNVEFPGMNPQKNVFLHKIRQLHNMYNKSSGRLWRPELVVCVEFW